MADELPRDEDFLATARRRFRMAEEAETDVRREYLLDAKFCAGEQWEASLKAQRLMDGRPCLTINRLPQFKRQVTNEQRQNRPGIKVIPVGDSDVETAEIIQGLCRHIEVQSSADIAYETAFDCMVTGGFGYFRILAEYCDEETDDQELRIKRILNSLSVYMDPGAVEPDRSDANFAFIVDDLTEEDFKATYPDTEASSAKDFQGHSDTSISEWCPGGKIRVAEYFYVETTHKLRVTLVDGTKVEDTEANIAALPKGSIVKKRRIPMRKVKWVKMTGVEVLERGELPIKYIPIVPVIADESIIEGRIQLSGMVRFAREPQRMYNVWVSAQTEMIALAPRAPFIAAAGQIEGFENYWKQSNTRSFSVIPYNPVDVAGHVLPPPQRQFAEPPIQAISAAVFQSDNDLKATTGIYDASLGARGPEESGKALALRQRQSSIANLNYIGNLSRAIKHCGRILINWIPYVYDTERVIRIVKPDMSQQAVPINQPIKGKIDPRTGVEKIYDLTTGKYDVIADEGPSLPTLRAEAADSMVGLVKAYPALMQFVGDLLVRNMDWPGAQEIADRLKKMLPPELQDNEDQPPVPPRVAAQLAQLSQINKALIQEVERLSQIIETKQMENNSKETIALINAQVELLKAHLTALSKETGEANKAAIAVMQAEMGELQQRLGILDQQDARRQQAELVMAQAATETPQ